MNNYFVRYIFLKQFQQTYFELFFFHKKKNNQKTSQLFILEFIVMYVTNFRIKIKQTTA